MTDATGDRAARAFVWSVWLVMTLACVVALVRWARNIPQTEDWLLVPTLTGNEPHPWRFLWAPNNEHRTPVPRLLLLGLLRLAHGDFRAGMVLNVGLLAALSAASIRLARVARGGTTRYADALFPVVLLHLGHWENLFWSWQATLVFAVVPVTAVLLLVVSDPGFMSVRSAVAGGVAVAVLPLSGANGLFFAPGFAGWLVYCGVLRWRTRRSVAVVLLGFATLALALTGLYFVGFERPAWVPPNPGVGPSLVAAAQFLALAFGPVARSSWVVSTAAAGGVLVLAAALTALGVLRARGPERQRALGLLVFLASVVLFALAMGWGRAAVVATEGFWPIRYSLLAVPLLLAAFFACELYGGRRAGAVAQNVLCGLVVVLVPLNTRHGAWWRDWNLAGATAVERDVMAGASEHVVADRHGAHLYHALDRAEIARLVHMLKRAGMGPWVHLADDELLAGPRMEQSFRYRRPGAARVDLVWGLDGWRPVPPAFRPAGTIVRRNVMQTPMVPADGDFVASVPVPAGATVDYGFLAAASDGTRPVWDGGWAVVPSGASPVAREAPPLRAVRDDASLLRREVRYRMPDAGEVFLVWGVDGWQTVPRAAADATTIAPIGRGADRADAMRTRMDRRGDVFVASIDVPAGAALDWGFLITDKRGILDLVAPVWDGRASLASDEVAATAALDVDAAVALPDEWAECVARWPAVAAAVAIVLATWALLVPALAVLERHARLLAMLAVALVACGGKPSPPTVAPEAIARLRDLVFADQDLDEVVKLQPPVDDPASPWPRLASAARLRTEDPEAAAAELEQVLALPALETRVQLWTWTALRGLGVEPDPASADVVQGVVVETPAGDGADTLAVFRDGTVRWFDHAGKAAFWDVHAPADREMADLVHAPIALAERMDGEERGTLTHPRPDRRPDAVRVSALSFRGVRCRELAPDALRKDEKLSAVVTAAGAIARKLSAAR